VNTGEHEFEAEPGLPEPLPAGERILWQGAPDWRTLAVEALHVRKIAIYFGVLMLWRGLGAAADGASVLEALASASVLLALALPALALLAGFAWLSARTTLYTLTDRRVVMRIGVVLSVTFNLPLRTIHTAALKAGRGGHGDIALTLAGPDRIAYLHLWPHARAWQLKRPQPLLRALPDAAAVAERLADALAQSAGPTLQPRLATPVDAQPHARPANAPMATA
jgi:Bacterial PH domain